MPAYTAEGCQRGNRKNREFGYTTADTFFGKRKVNSMAESYYYLVKFHAHCEECGKRFDGVVAKEVPVNDSAIAGNIVNSMADSADLAIRRKSLEGAVRDKRWQDLDMSYGLSGHGCPYCGARQSWDPMKRPEVPKRTAKGKAGNIVAALFAAFFVGGILALIEYLIQSFVFGEDDPTFLFILWAVCLVVGVVLAIRSNKKDDQKAVASYPERMKEYERELAAYEAFQREVEARSIHNEPDVDLSSGTTSPLKLDVDELDKANPYNCPNCGKKLEGQVRVGSVHAARVANGCCPWCGEKLPANRRISLGTK